MFKQNLPILEEIFSFLRNPQSFLEKKSELNFWQTLWYVIQIIGFCITAGILIGLITEFVSKLFGYSQEENNIIISTLVDIPPLVAGLFLVIIGPFFEELSFRLFLRPKKFAFLLGLVFFVLFFASSVLSYFNISLPQMVTNYTTLISGEIGISFLITLLILAGLLLGCLSLVFRFIDKEKAEKFVYSRFNYLVYFSSVIFALMHITNYENLEKFWWLAPVFILPQLLVGLILPFVRTKFGFWWSVFTHSCYNFVLGVGVIAILAGSDAVRKLILEPKNADDAMKTLSQADQIYVGGFGLISGWLYLTAFTLAAMLVYNFWRNGNFRKK